MFAWSALTIRLLNARLHGRVSVQQAKYAFVYTCNMYEICVDETGTLFKPHACLARGEAASCSRFFTFGP